VLAFIESGGSSSDFPLPIDVVNASPFVAKDSEKKKFVEYRTLLLDKAGARLSKCRCGVPPDSCWS
jgi:hypothetical protein